jgi:hypothetical protein
MKRTSFLFPIFFTIISLPNLYGQQELKFITKTVEKQFAYKTGDELNIEGEKADVEVESWNKNIIDVRIVFSAQHPDKKIAQRDLEWIQYQTEKVQNKIYLRNYLKIPEGQTKPRSTLKATYVIKVPSDCPVYLKSQFGMVRIRDLSNQVKLNSTFTNIGLENIQGFIDITSKFGDLDGKFIDGTMLVNARRTDITLRELKGKYDLKTSYGTLNIFADPNVADLKLTADNTKIHLVSSDPSRFAFNIEAKGSDLNLPNQMNFNVLEASNDPSIKRFLYTPKKEYYANFTIVVTFSEFTLSVDK